MTISKNKILHFPFFRSNFFFASPNFRAPTSLTQSLLGFSLILTCGWIFMRFYDWRLSTFGLLWRCDWILHFSTKIRIPSARASKNTMNAKADANTDRRANNENHISLLSSRSVVENAKLSNSQLHICIFSMVNWLPEIYHWTAPILQACISSVTRTHFPAAPSEVQQIALALSI